MNKKNVYIIVGICLLCIATLAGTVAYYRQVLFNDLNVNTITRGLDYYINYTKGQDIASATLSASADYTGGQNAEIELWKSDNTYDIYGHIYLDVNEIGTYSSSSSALKYALVNGNTVVSQGTLKGRQSGTSIPLAVNIPLVTTKQLYKVYIWIDQNEELDVNMENETLSLSVRCEATMKTV